MKILKHFGNWRTFPPSLVCLVTLGLVIPLSGIEHSYAQDTGTTTTFDIVIPKRGEGPASKAIAEVQATIVMEKEGAVEFRVTAPEASTQNFVFNSSTTCGGVPDPCDHTFPSGDDLTWELPTVGTPTNDDPANVIYKLIISANSNTSFSGGNCEDVMPGVFPGATETFTVEVISGPGTPRITGACLLSFDLSAPGAACNNIGPPLQDSDVATIDAGSATAQFCQELRPGVDSALVLDKSGSMNSSPMAGPSARKIDALKIAVDKFVNRWSIIRTGENTPPDDNIGVILFDSDDSWLGGGSALASFASVAFGISGNPGDPSDGLIGSVNPGGLTSIGDGLFTASNALFAPPVDTNSNRKTVLLMSDGRENTLRRVRLWDSGPDSGPAAVLQWSDIGTIPVADFQSRINIQLGSDATSWDNLPNESGLSIYAVTVGASTAVSAEVNQGLAMATGGFYINSETNADILSTYFIELLQNFVKFNTWNMVALRSADVGLDNGAVQPYAIDFPLPSTSQAASIDLSWNPQFGHVCLDVMVPGAAEAETVCSSQENQAAGSLSWTKNLLAADPPVDTSTEWHAEIRPMVVHTHVASVEFPVFLAIMAEDSNVKSDYGIGVDDYVPGSRIPLHVTLKESGKALATGMNVSALVASPNQSVGELLAASNAGTGQPDGCTSGCDTDTDADAKLANELSENPEALVQNFNPVALLDNGNSGNGDQTAGDGIYSGLYEVDAPGHYNVLFKAAGATERSGSVQREQLLSLVVRNQPDAGETTVDTSISGGSDSSSQTLNIQFKPATKGGHAMGPGWANYFWFTGTGVKPFKGSDNLDGTYSAAVNFSGETPPEINLHFLDVAQVIEDSATHDSLPIPFDSSIFELPVTGGASQDCQWYDLTCGTVWWKYLILLILVLLILFLLLKKQPSGS